MVGNSKPFARKSSLDLPVSAFIWELEQAVTRTSGYPAIAFAK